jgi:hypothetical protein
MTIIGVSGKAQSGKDTFSEMLVKELNKNTFPPYVMMAFAHELKVRCQEAFDLTWDQLWGSDKEKEDERYPKADGGFWTAREIMQNFGAWYRSVDKNYWVKNLFRVIDSKDYKNVIITDVRYLNEANYIRGNGGIILRVNRNDKSFVHNSEHASETELDNYKFDFEVVNNYSLAELEKTAVECCFLMRELNKLGD